LSFLKELKRRNVLRVGAAYVVGSWLLIQVAETIFPLFGYGDTPARLVVIVLAIAFIPSLIFAWVFEITPEGLKKDADVVREHSITQTTGKKLDRIILLVLALALAYFAFDKFVLDPARDQSKVEIARQEGRTEAIVDSYGDKSIAVLPFVNMSDDADNEYFSDGISEELLNILSKIPELRVISRSSAFSFKGKDIDIPTIAKQLNVAHVLEGSVRKSGNQVRITAQLIEARTDTHLWSESYDRSLEDIFAIQDEITADVVNMLKATLLGTTPTVEGINPEAYTLYLQARHFRRQGTEEGVEKAYSMLQQALDIDSQYAPLWNDLSTIYLYQVDLGKLPFEEGYLKAREASRHALEIDPNNAQTLASLGWDALFSLNDLPAAASYFHSARKNAPNNPVVLGDIATFAAVIGKLEDAIDLLELAIKYDPVDSAKYTNLGAFHLATGNLDNADVAFTKALELSPDDVWTQQAIVYLRILQNRPDDALQILENLEHEQFHLIALPMILNDLGRVEDAHMALDKLRNSPGAGASHYDIAEVYAHLNLVNEAFESLELAIKNAENVSFIRTSAFLRKLSEDSRWIDILIQVGLADEQVSGFEL
jgi:adenylate cyclase